MLRGKTFTGPYEMSYTISDDSASKLLESLGVFFFHLCFRIEIKNSSDRIIKLVVEKKHRRHLKGRGACGSQWGQGKEEPSSSATAYKAVTLLGSSGRRVSVPHQTCVILWPPALACGMYGLLCCLQTCVLVLQQRLLVPSSSSSPYCNRPEYCSVPTGDIGADRESMPSKKVEENYLQEGKGPLGPRTQRVLPAYQASSKYCFPFTNKSFTDS